MNHKGIVTSPVPLVLFLMTFSQPARAQSWERIPGSDQRRLSPTGSLCSANLRAAKCRLRHAKTICVLSHATGL
jgi:hypothetical protein